MEEVVGSIPITRTTFEEYLGLKQFWPLVFILGSTICFANSTQPNKDIVIRGTSHENLQCSYCQSLLGDGTDIYQCQSCGTSTHRECSTALQQDKGKQCPTMGCSDRQASSEKTVEKVRKSAIWDWIFFWRKLYFRKTKVQPSNEKTLAPPQLLEDDSKNISGLHQWNWFDRRDSFKTLMGPIYAGHLKAGDSVYSYDFKTRKFVINTVRSVKIISENKTRLLRVWEPSGVFDCPHRRRVKLQNGHLVEARNLQVSDAIFIGQRRTFVTSLTSTEADYPLFEIELDGPQNLISTDGFIVMGERVSRPFSQSLNGTNILIE